MNLKIIISIKTTLNLILFRVILCGSERKLSQNYDGEILVIPKEYNRAYEKRNR